MVIIKNDRIAVKSMFEIINNTLHIFKYLYN